MQKSPLVSILKTFSKKEIKEFRKWLNSPSHNLRKDIINLFEFFFQGNQIHKTESLDKRTVFSWIFPKETYDDARMRQVMYFLLRSTEEFLIWHKISEDKILLKRTLSTVFRERKLIKAFQKSLKDLKQVQESHQFRNELFFQNEFFIQKEEYAYLSKVERLSFNLQEVTDSLDLLFITSKLRQIVLMATHQNVYKTEYKIGFINEILSYSSNPELLNIPAVAIYYYGYKTITEKGNDNHYQNLKKQIIENGHFFPLSELRDIYLMIINYCINKMNEGHEYFIREAFELYQEGFKESVFIENNILSRWTFLNVISIGLKLKEFNWIENFITEYQVFLEEQHRESVSHYSMASLHFESKNYDSAMILLNQVEYDDHILMFIEAKKMLTKIYFEEDEIDALESLLESMRTYLQRKKVMGYHKANYKNFIRFTKRLLKIKPNDKPAQEKLKAEINNADPLTNNERSWLLNQVGKLK